MKKNFLQFVILIFVLASFSIFSQSGMSFPEFKNKLQNYFNAEMISDIERNLPQKINFSIWGWDIGDFSGDNNPDLAFSVKISQEKRKVAYVYLFVDIDGFLELVFNQPYEYHELPLEIGVSIKNNSCSITQKKKNDYWNIETYRFNNGVIYLIGNYSSERHTSYFVESEIDYTNCRKKITYEPITGGASEKIFSDFLFVPSYPRRKEIYEGYPAIATSKNVDFVTKGSYYWFGERDASMSIRSSFDENFIYLSFYITDDTYVPKNCPNCLGDELVLWFDFNPVASSMDRLFKKFKNWLSPRNKPDENTYQIQISLGNFIDIPPEILSFNSSATLDETQKSSLNKIKIFSNPTDSGLVVKIRLPFELFGYQVSPMNKEEVVIVGLTAVYNDVDNEYRPEETSLIATSLFEEGKPSTFGELVFISDFKSFSFAHNVYLEAILKSLEDFGF